MIVTAKTLNEIIRDIVLYARGNNFDEILLVQDYFADKDCRMTRREAEKLIDYMLMETKEKP